jgi:hypothetical protein
MMDSILAPVGAVAVSGHAKPVIFVDFPRDGVDGGPLFA